MMMMMKSTIRPVDCRPKDVAGLVETDESGLVDGGAAATVVVRMKRVLRHAAVKVLYTPRQKSNNRTLTRKRTRAYHSDV